MLDSLSREEGAAAARPTAEAAGSFESILEAFTREP